MIVASLIGLANGNQHKGTEKTVEKLQVTLKM
jgi:hypothetical protein